MIKKSLLSAIVTLLLVLLLVSNTALAKSQVTTNIGIESDKATVNVGVDSKKTNLNVYTGKKSNINVDTGIRSEVFINGEGLNDLRPQYHIKKTSYNDTWIKSELQLINDYLAALDQGLGNMYAKESNEVNELFRALAMLRSELYQEMYRLHFGQTVVKTIIGSDVYTVNSDILKLNTLTSYRVNDFLTLMSIRVLEPLGVQIYFERVNEIGIVTLIFGDKNIVLREDSDIMVVFDSKEAKKIKLKAPVVIKGSRAYIPTRDVSEHLGFEVLWDEGKDTIMISLPQAEKPQIEIDEAIYAESSEEDEENIKEEEAKEESKDMNEEKTE